MKIASSRRRLEGRTPKRLRLLHGWPGRRGHEVSVRMPYRRLLISSMIYCAVGARRPRRLALHRSLST